MNIDAYKDKILNLNSDFYDLDSKDKKALQKYINHLMYDIIAGLHDRLEEYVMSSYFNLVTLIEFAIRQSVPVLAFNGNHSDPHRDDLIVSMLNYYMDGIEGDSAFYKEIENLTGLSEKRMREVVHQDFKQNVENAILSVRQDFPDFLEEEVKPRKAMAEEEVIEYANQMMLQKAEICITKDLNRSFAMVKEMYDNIQSKGFLMAKRRMESMLFRLSVLKYYNVSERIGSVYNKLYCMQTEKAAAYRMEVIRLLDQSFDRARGRKLFEAGKQSYECGDYEQALDYYKKSALCGDAEGACNLSYMLSEGKECQKDEFTEAFWLWQAAQMGNAEAMTNLGVKYCKGDGVCPSAARGLYWFAAAALKHNASAVYNIGISLEKEEVIQGYADLGTEFKQAAVTVQSRQDVALFVERNAGIILEMTAEMLIESEGGI